MAFTSAYCISVGRLVGEVEDLGPPCPAENSASSAYWSSPGFFFFKVKQQSVSTLAVHYCPVFTPPISPPASHSFSSCRSHIYHLTVAQLVDSIRLGDRKCPTFPLLKMSRLYIAPPPPYCFCQITFTLVYFPTFGTAILSNYINIMNDSPFRWRDVCYS